MQLKPLLEYHRLALRAIAFRIALTAMGFEDEEIERGVQGDTAAVIVVADGRRVGWSLHDPGEVLPMPPEDMIEHMDEACLAFNAADIATRVECYRAHRPNDGAKLVASIVEAGILVPRGRAAN